MLGFVCPARRIPSKHEAWSTLKRSSDDKLFAIGDVHGCADELRELLEQLPLDPECTVVFLGDYIDRGDQSREVVDQVLELQSRCKVVPLIGNHEMMLLEFLDGSDPRKVARFIYNGGSATLASYADEHGQYAIPDSHLEFFAGLSFFHQTEEFFFVHAGVPDIALDRIDPDEHGETMIWVRGPFLQSAFEWGRRIVHGHTPVSGVDIQPRRINLDTACVYDYALSAMAFPSLRTYSVPRKKRIEPLYLRDLESRRRAVRFPGQVTVRVPRAEAVYEFHTVDYSEIGMYMRLDGPRDPRFEIHDAIAGTIGDGENFNVRFLGKIVRVARGDDEIGYGVRIIDKA